MDLLNFLDPSILGAAYSCSPHFNGTLLSAPPPIPIPKCKEHDADTPSRPKCHLQWGNYHIASQLAEFTKTLFQLSTRACVFQRLLFYEYFQYNCSAIHRGTSKPYSILKGCYSASASSTTVSRLVVMQVNRTVFQRLLLDGHFQYNCIIAGFDASKPYSHKLWISSLQKAVSYRMSFTCREKCKKIWSDGIFPGKLYRYSFHWLA